jgi:hypothetical protein
VTLGRSEFTLHLAGVHYPRKLRRVLSPEEVAVFWKRRPNLACRGFCCAATAAATPCHCGGKLGHYDCYGVRMNHSTERCNLAEWLEH